MKYLATFSRLHSSTNFTTVIEVSRFLPFRHFRARRRAARMARRLAYTFTYIKPLP